MTNRQTSDESHTLEGNDVQPVPVTAPKQISSTELLCGDNEVIIQHEGERYRLRLTRNGKLILHK